MVWAGISVNGKSELYVIENGTLVALSNCNEILDQFVRQYAEALGPVFIHVTNAYLEREIVVRMEWPARSLDLNLIEHA